jgi:hypothetical protein
MRFPKLRAAVVSAGALAAALIPATAVHSTAPASLHCERGTATCAELADSEEVFGEGVYIGHDEPSLLFYSNQAGSGNRMKAQLTLPTDPRPVPKDGRSFNFQLHPAFWFGMALCDTNSFPNAVSTCAPDSDSNIATLATHPGAAFMELQFYPPGWAPAPLGSSCDARRYCVAIASFSLAEDAIRGTFLNDACASRTGLEYANYAFLTRSGHPHAAPNPVQATASTFTPNPATDLFMNPGDRLSVSMHDTSHGLRIDVMDQTTEQQGSMTMSANNGFGMVKYVPNPSTECTNIPYDFHPMYSTSSEQTRVIWAAHSYNVAFSDEIGHFDNCTNTVPDPNNAPFKMCATSAKEGIAGDRETAEGPPTATNAAADDNFCFSANQSTLVRMAGCQGTNQGFDGVSYKPLWADGNRDHAGAFFFTSPRTGEEFDTQYQRVAFEADLPRIEIAPSFQNCDRTTGANCTLIPVTDDGTPADFYPFYSLGTMNGQCTWTLANDIPGFTTNDFGKNAQYGSLLNLEYLRFGAGGATRMRINDFRGVIPNPCGGEGEDSQQPIGEA